MPKASDTGELHRHASQRSYAFHNNLHANAQSKSGPVLAILGAEPRTARAPKQHKGEGVVAQLDPKRPPQHYFAVVTQRYLTLTPLAPSKTIGSTGYARTRDTVVVKAKKAPEKKRVPLEPSASWRPGRRGTIATPGTAAVIDERLENALEKEDDEEKEEELEELEGWDSNMVNRIDLDEVRSIEAVPFSLRMATIAEAAAEDEKNAKKTDKNSLDSFEFADPELEAHAVHVLIDVEGRRPFVVLTYQEQSDFSNELVGAHRTALRRNALGLRPSKVADPRAFAAAYNLRTTRRDATEADLDHAFSVIDELENAICDDSDDDHVYDDEAEREHDLLQKRKQDQRYKEYGERMARDPSMPLPLIVARPPNGRLEKVRRLEDDGCYRDARLLRDVEDDLATDVALKRAFFTSGRLAARILAWVERLSSDIAACAELEGAYCAAYDLDEDDDQAKRVIRKAQTGLVVRAVQGLKILRAALHDARGVKERFSIMRFRFWSPSRIVQALARDHFNHTDRIQEKEDLRRAREARATRRKQIAAAGSEKAAKDHRKTAREALQRARETFIQKHLTHHTSTPQTPGAPATPHAAVAAFSAALSKPAPSRKVVSYRSITEEMTPGETFADAAYRLSRGCETTQKRQAILTAVKAASSTKKLSGGIASAATRLLASPVKSIDDDDSSVSTTSTASSALFRAAQSMQQDSPSSVASSKSRAESFGDLLPQSSDSSVSVLQRPAAVFVHDDGAATAFGDVPTLRGDALLATDDALHFTRLLDAQVDVLVALDDVCDARRREGDAQVWLTGLNDDADSMPRPMEGRWVAMALAPGNDTVHGSRLLLSALFERCVALGLRLAKAPDLTITRKNFFPDQSQAIALYGAGDQSALALLNHSTLLLALLRAGHMARACAHEFCRDEVDDFLAKDEFYEPLDANRITRLAASNLREAVRLARAADDSAQAARDRQLSGGRV